MTRDWKKIAGVAAYRHESDGGSRTCLDNPELVVTDLPPTVCLHALDEPRLVLEDDEFSPKKIRSFLWEHRKSRAVSRERAVLVTEVTENGNEIKMSALTHVDAKERING